MGKSKSHKKRKRSSSSSSSTKNKDCGNCNTLVKRMEKLESLFINRHTSRSPRPHIHAILPAFVCHDTGSIQNLGLQTVRVRFYAAYRGIPVRSNAAAADFLPMHMLPLEPSRYCHGRNVTTC